MHFGRVSFEISIHPCLGCERRSGTRSEYRQQVHSVANDEWQRLCTKARQSSDLDALLKLEKNRGGEFKAVIDYDDRQLD